MQNTEIDDIENKLVKFLLIDKEEKEFSQKNIGKGEYLVLWYDSKMKNYISFLEYLEKKKFIQAQVNAILIVEKQEHLSKVIEIQRKSKISKVKDQVKVMKTHTLSQEEALKRELLESGEEGWSKAGEEDEEEKAPLGKDEIELSIEKNNFYLISPEGRIIDTAKIYSFLHEDNIFKRITAKISKHVDDQISKS